MSDWLDAENHVERAHELYDAGRWDEAETELRRALSLNPYQSEWHFNLGLTLEAAGRHDEAAGCFTESFELADGDATTALAVASNLIRAGKAEQSLPWIDKAAEAEPESVEPHVHRLDAYTALGRHDEAEEAFYLAQQIAADHAELYAAMAESLMERRLFDKAVWCLREAARLDPELPRVEARLAEAFAATGRLERARQLLLRELRRDPGDTETLLDLGVLLVDMNRLTEADEKFRRVLELEPDHADAHFHLAELAERRGDVSNALVLYDVVLRLDHSYREARRKLASVLMSRGRDEDLPRVRDLLRIELRAALDDTNGFGHDALSDLGGLLLDARLPAEAAEAFARLITVRPADHLAHHHLSIALLEMGDTAGGVAAARKALTLEPRCVPAMHNLALAHLRQGQWLRARYWAKQGSRLDPDDAPIRRLRLLLRLYSLRLVGGVLGRVAIRVGRRGRGLLGRPRRLPYTAS